MAISFKTIRNYGLTLMLLIVALVGLIPSFILARIAGPNANMSQKLLEVQKAVMIEKQFSYAKGYFNRIINGESRDVDPVIKRIDDSLEICRSLFEIIPKGNEKERTLVRNFEEAGESFKKAVITYKEELTYDPTGSGAKEMEFIAIDAVEKTHETLISLVIKIQEDINRERTAMTDSIKEGQIFAFIGFLVSVVCGVVVSVLVSRALSSSIKSLVAGTHKIAAGDLEHRIKVTTKDEIGELAESFNHMAERLFEDEAELKKTNKELSIKEQRLKTVLSAITHPICIVNVNDYSLQVLNSAAESRLEKSASSQIKCYEFSHNRNSPCSSKEHPCPVEEVVRSGKPTVVEHIHKDEKGFERTIELHAFPIFDNEGNVVQIVESSIDVTDRKEAEKERASLEGRLNHARKMEAIGALAAGIAHEINTPIQFIGDNTEFTGSSMKELLCAVEAYQSLFRENPGNVALEALKEKEEAIREACDLGFYKEELPLAFEQTKEGIDRVTKIVRAMKEFSHKGSEKMNFEDINKAIENTITISRNEWKYYADLDQELDPGLPLVRCVIGDIKQVVLNLIVNASHAIKELVEESGDETKGRIRIKTCVTGTNAIIEVKDTGAGIPEDARDKVFDHFFTTKEVGKGTGQGLSMAYQTVVKKHGGKIWFETETGKGTSFFIALPLMKEEDL
jgi:signal transduction histidine kinase/HAMP domain-containing protein